MAALVSLDRPYLQTNVEKLSNQTGFMDSAVNTVANPLRALQALSELMERGTRVGEFAKTQKKALKKGKEPKEAILEGGIGSREVTLDFQRIGAKTRAMNMLIAFFNANVQGTDKALRAFKNNPLRTTARIAAGITLPSVLLYLHNRDDPDWKEILQWQKDLFWLFKVPGVDNDFGPSALFEHTKDATWFRIPKPFGLGTIFGSGAERITEFILSKDASAFDELLESVARGVTPGIMPTAMVPFVEQFANKSTFTDRKIIPRSRERLLPEYRYSLYTTESAKALGKLVARIPGLGDTNAASPSIIENYIFAWTGGLGRHVLNTADFFLRKSGAVPDPIKPADTLADIPFVRGFIVRFPTAGSESINKFYKASEKQSQFQRSIKALIVEGEIDEAEKLIGRAMSEGQLTQVQGIREALSNASKTVRMIFRNKEMTRDEKRQTIDAIYYQMIEMAKVGNAVIKEGKKAAKDFSAQGIPLSPPPLPAQQISVDIASP